MSPISAHNVSINVPISHNLSVQCPMRDVLAICSKRNFTRQSKIIITISFISIKMIPANYGRYIMNYVWFATVQVKALSELNGAKVIWQICN